VTLLDILADTGALLRLPEELRALDSDLADTVQTLVSKADTVAANHPDEAVSKQKLLQMWDDLWGRWNSHVCEVGDEQGDYAIKDSDWEPPYINLKTKSHASRPPAHSPANSHIGPAVGLRLFDGGHTFISDPDSGRSWYWRIDASPRFCCWLFRILCFPKSWYSRTPG
jgi:hypothetical protein